MQLQAGFSKLSLVRRGNHTGEEIGYFSKNVILKK
uniref:Uncharacterized protein n=1 Tax=Anguilla anguilla TaxID=7936 RepID=A0A0E9TAL7_ANGAN